MNWGSTQQREEHEKGLIFNIHKDVLRCQKYTVMRLLKKSVCVWAEGGIRKIKGHREKGLTPSPDAHHFISVFPPSSHATSFNQNMPPLLPKSTVGLWCA